MIQKIKQHIIPILCTLAAVAPIVGMLLIELYYYSTVIGWAIGFCCIMTAYIIITKRPDKDESATYTEI
ncbi:hypothetical protein [Metabacillus malikii]|uniref:SNF family Na+-dependent transporter n=1 Tax=Metabacillus malikii TaxID=1504265 RepID=A0ABT9ZB56_9BACI|nr:hypothetical protein [Metabacillus malikii]MDQ0229497.1 SNF family Na+-dependent transporter [Metabacillus malikii]